MQTEQKKIYVYSYPMMGHIIPILAVAEILKKHQNWSVTFFTSQVLVPKIKKIYPKMQIVGIADFIQTTSTVVQMIFKLGPSKTLFKFYAKSQGWFEHFAKLKQESFKPNLILSDIYCIDLVTHAKNNKIPVIINVPNNLQVIQQAWNFPTLKRSFRIGGFTVLYPSFHISQIVGVQSRWNSTLRGSLFFFNTAYGFDNPSILPPNYRMVGPIARQESQTKTVTDLQCLNWINKKKQEGFQKFIYIAFGTIGKIGKQVFQVFYQTLCKLKLPVLWSFDSELSQKITNPLFYVKDWLPQITILKLEEVKVFVTHCGWNSINEAIIYEKPLILLPICFDQIENANQIINKKIGLKLFEHKPSFFSITINPKGLKSSSFLLKFQEILQNPIYKQNIKKVHKLWKYVKTQQIILDSAQQVMQMGSQHLVDQLFENAKTRKHWHTIVLLLSIIIVVFMIRCFYS